MNVSPQFTLAEYDPRRLDRRRLRRFTVTASNGIAASVSSVYFRSLVRMP